MTAGQRSGTLIDELPASAHQLQPDPGLESRGRLWLLGSFVFCPCHLPLTIAVLAAVLGGTGLASMVRDNAVVVGVIVTLLWLGGTAYGFRLLRRARSGAACGRPGESSRLPGQLRP
jgi:mercuric ion transport protein